MKNKQMIRLAMGLLVIAFSLLPYITMAQPCDPGTIQNPNVCPIDGGLSLLLAAGLGYGVKRFRDARKKDIATTV